MALCFAAPALANPNGANVVSGKASFAASGNSLTVTNTPGAIINWQQFSIQPNEITRFVQQNAASAVLNRVIGGDPSAILGTLASNGRVFLINASGITIGAGARIDVAGFVASTLNLSDADFLSGRRMFQGTGAEGALRNEGRITTPEGGFVYLVAPRVENGKDAVITSPGGEVVIAAGRTVELVSSLEPDVRVEYTAGGEAANAGAIVAASGRVGIYGTLVRSSGLVSASRAEVGAGGKIVFRAQRDALLESGARVEATGDTGGTVQVLGERVGVLDGASIDASGDAGGGTVLVGGDFQGKNADVPNAWRTYFGADASIVADGGKVVVWSDDVTRAYGTIRARGGFVEVSGANLLDFAAKVEAGTILLDPRDIGIQNSNGGAVVGASVMFADGSGDFAVSDETLEGLIGNVVLQASRDITIDNNLSGGLTLANAGQGITLQAGRHITVGSTITTQGGAIHLEADSPHAPATGSTDGRNPADGVGQLAFTSNGGAHSNGGHITLIAGGNPINNQSGPDGGIALSENRLIDAGAGGISIGLSGNAPLGVGSIGLVTQILGNPMDELHTTGALVIGSATTAGPAGNGVGGIALLADSISNIYPASAMDLSPASGSTFSLVAGSGGILLDQPLTTYQPTIISTTGTLTINDPINTTNHSLQITAANVVTGGNGSINTGSGACTGPGCPVSGTFWDGGGDGMRWFDEDNWSGDRLPTLADLVTIPGGAGTIVVDAAGAQAKSIIANRAFEISGSGTLLLEEPSQFSDLLRLAGGSLLGEGSASVTGPGGQFLWSGGTMAAGGTFQLVSGRSGTLSGSLFLERLFQNEGLLTLSNATLSGSGTLASSGSVTAAAGTTNSVSTLFQNIAGTIPGTLQVNGALTMGAFPVNDGAIVIGAGGAFSTGTMANLGSIGGTGDFTVTTDFDPSTGTLGTTFSDLSLARSGAFSIGDLGAADSITLRAGGAVSLYGDVTVTGGSGDSVVIAGTSFLNPGDHAINPGGGRFLVWSGDPSADDRGGLAYDFKQYNASFGDTVLGSGNGFLYTASPVVTAGLAGTVGKVYDATTAATLNAGNYTVSGAIDGDTVTLNNPLSGVYADKNAGTGKNVSVDGIAIAGASNGSATVYGYQLAGTTAGANIGEITPALLELLATSDTKLFDASTAS
ncbi:MAG TPA: filamentous hemagglutinin N-terminal domain-containing protein, partial [Burkholderiales bacterium]|nr:filamentous hemagglutinin N-terminal domain-containing protein [Burkholderiales bacterium]